MNKMKIGFLTTSDISTANGHVTRILSELEQLKLKNISVSVLSFLHVRYWKNKAGVLDYTEAIKNLGYNVFIVPVFPDKQNALLYKAVDQYRLWFLRRFVRKHSVLILHCHGPQATYLAACAIRDSLIPIVYDMHGISSAEQLSKWGVHSPAMKRLEITEKAAISGCRAVISVSNGLQNYWQNRYPDVSPQSYVIPCAVDSHLFSFRLDARDALREKWNVSIEDPVFAYLGSAVYYQRIDKVFGIFKYMLSAFSKAKLLIISPQSDISLIKKIMKEIGVNLESVIIISLGHDEVPEYLSAADFGFLIRDDLLLNNTSSPTKFGEYLGCGVPVITSPNVIDVKSAVEENNIGFVFDDNFDQLSQFVNLVMAQRIEWARRCELYAQDFYSWDSYGQKLLEIYGRLPKVK